MGKERTGWCSPLSALPNTPAGIPAQARGHHCGPLRSHRSSEPGGGHSRNGLCGCRGPQDTPHRCLPQVSGSVPKAEHWPEKSDFRIVFLTKVRTNPATHRLGSATALSTGLAQKSQQWLQERVVPRLALLPSFPLCLLPIVLFFIDKSFCGYKPMQHDAVFLAVLTRACLACFGRAHSQKPPCGLSIHDYIVKWSNKSNQHANHIRYLSFLHDEAPYNPISYLEIDCTEAREMPSG